MPLDAIAYKPYADPDDFIREVTDLIWVNRAIGHIYENYEPDAIVHGSYGTSVGVEEVVQGSLMRISATPGPRRPGRGRGVGGSAATTRSSARTSCSRWTPSTDFISRTVANCLYRRGRMVEEWVVRDFLAICLQLGQDPDEVARMKPFIGYSGSMLDPAAGERPRRRRLGRAARRLPLRGADGARVHRAGLERARPQRGRAVLGARPDPAHDRLPHDHPARGLPPLAAARCSGRSRAGASRSATCRRTTPSSYAGLRVAVTWVYKGDYNGTADFGPLTGTPVEILGVSQFLVQDGRLVREVRVYDEIAVRSQIHDRRGDSEFAGTNIY